MGALQMSNPLDMILELVAKCTTIAYLVNDHLAWLKQMKIITSGKEAADVIKRAMTFFMVANATSTVIQLKKLSSEKDEAKKGPIRTTALKHGLLVIQCAHLSTVYETHNALVGTAGVISSFIDVKAQWPDQK